MCGIYLHIPFCKQACHYCNFHFSTSLKLQNDFLQALLKEIVLRKDYADAGEINTIYFGGGTPSLLSEQDIHRILFTIKETYRVAPDAEITLEANPDDITTDVLRAWRTAGINRLSMGIQSFFDEDLHWMNRAHNAEQATHSIEAALAEGFGNVTIDLIYGGPTLSDERWKENLQRAIDYGIPHLSCYALTVEQKTPLQVMIKKKKVMGVVQEDQARHFEIMCALLEANGYEQYEISNFARPGHRSRHNSAYWSGKKYIGLGPSAHSFNGTSRQWNVASNPLYIQSLQHNILPFELETLTDPQQFNEYIMTSLRTMEGADMAYVTNRFGESYRSSLIDNAGPFIRKGWLQENKKHLVLTNEGKLFADGIASDLFILSVAD